MLCAILEFVTDCVECMHVYITVFISNIPDIHVLTCSS